MAERLSLVFDGRLATNGTLHFYEYGRASYGYARFIATIESFRRTGRVTQRIVAGSNVDLIIEAPRQGSFPIDIIAPIATALGTELASLPLKVLVEYVLHSVQRLLPQQEDALLSAARIQLEVERQRTAQTSEETKRVQSIERMVREQSVTTRSALELIQQAQSQQSRALGAFDGVNENVEEIKDRLSLMERREATFEEYAGQLESVDTDRMLKLTSKVRPQIAEMALPLRKSANSMAFTIGDDRVVAARLNRKEVADINSRQLDAEPSTERVRFAAYDRDTGVGKLDLLDHDIVRLNYSVPREIGGA